MPDFIDRNSIVRTIWGNSDLILLIFAGSAAEFALNRTVDWLFFTGKIPADPIGRLFSTVRYAQEIVFVDEETSRRTLNRINAQHDAVQRQRGQTIPDWAFRDVLYMLVDYSERAHNLIYGPLSQDQKEELFSVFRRIGEGLCVKELPENYEDWRHDRILHLRRDLVYSRHTSLLFRSYRRHLGFWRYYLLREIQALLVPDEVKRLLELNPSGLYSTLAKSYSIVERYNLRSLVHTLLIPPTYWADVQKFDKFSAAT